MPSVYGYTRVSTLIQAEDGESLGAQQRKLEGWAMMQGTALAAVLSERGVSGGIPLNDRPEGARLLTMVRKGDTIVASKLDRMFRSALDALQVVAQLQDRGVHLVLLDLNGDVTADGMAKFFLTLAAAFAEVERHRVRERITDVKKDQKKRGRYLGGKIPFGYRVGNDGNLIAINEEQQVIGVALAMRAEGKPLRAIRERLADLGFKLSLDAVHRMTGGAPA